MHRIVNKKVLKEKGPSYENSLAILAQPLLAKNGDSQLKYLSEYVEDSSGLTASSQLTHWKISSINNKQHHTTQGF